MNHATPFARLLGEMLRWWRRVVLPHFGKPTAPAALADRLPLAPEVKLSFAEVCASYRRWNPAVPR